MDPTGLLSSTQTVSLLLRALLVRELPVRALLLQATLVRELQLQTLLVLNSWRGTSGAVAPVAGAVSATLKGNIRESGSCLPVDPELTQG